MVRRRRNQVVIWEWSPGRTHEESASEPGRKHRQRRPKKDLGKSFTLIIAGLGFLYFGWVFSATGIFTAHRGYVAIAASEDPRGFSYAVGMVLVLGIVSLAAGLVTMLRR